MNYLIIFIISMIPIVELRGAMVYATAHDLTFFVALPICVLGNMLPVPVIYFFARKVLVSVKKRYIGKICRFFLEKGEKAGKKLVKATGRGGLFFGIAAVCGHSRSGHRCLTGTLGASFLNMGFKSTVAAVSLGVVLAGVIMALLSTGVFAVIGL